MVAHRGLHLCTEIQQGLAWSTSLPSREFQASMGSAVNICLKTKDTAEGWIVEHCSRGTCRAGPKWGVRSTMGSETKEERRKWLHSASGLLLCPTLSSNPTQGHRTA